MDDGWTKEGRRMDEEGTEKKAGRDERPRPVVVDGRQAGRLGATKPRRSQRHRNFPLERQMSI